MDDRPALEQLFGADGIGTVFHPIVECLPAPRVHAYEALMRGPKGLPFEGPMLAFALAKSMEVLEDLDLRCLRAALAGGPNQLLFVNLHPVTAVSVDADRIEAIVRESGRRPEGLVLEIVEHDSGRESEMVRAVSALRKRGFGIAIDDFGEGSSNLRRLLRMGCDYLKIDRWFVQGCDRDRDRRAAVRAIAGLADDLGIRVVAEGVESSAQLDIVLNCGIRLVQGFGLEGLVGEPGVPLPDVRPDAPGDGDTAIDPVLQRIDDLDERLLDRLPFGAIQLAPDGTVLQYNRYEENLAGFKAANVVGRNFFTEVAPCTDVREFAGRFRDGVAAGELNVTFDYTFSFAPPKNVRVTLYLSERTRTIWVFVQER